VEQRTEREELCKLKVWSARAPFPTKGDFMKRKEYNHVLRRIAENEENDKNTRFFANILRTLIADHEELRRTVESRVGVEIKD